MFSLLFPAAGMSLYMPDVQMWRWGRNYGKVAQPLARGLSIKKLSTSASRLAQKLYTTCWQYTSLSEVRLKQLNLDLSFTAHRLTTSLNLPETEGGLLMFSHSGITPKQCFEGNLARGSLCCISPCSSTAFQCSVICTVLSSISFFFVVRVSEMWMSECKHSPVVLSKRDFLQVSWQWYMQCSCRSSSASNLEKSVFSNHTV